MRRKKKYPVLLLAAALCVGGGGCGLEELSQKAGGLWEKEVQTEEETEQALAGKQAVSQEELPGEAEAYGYASLSSREQEIYGQLVQGIESFQKEIGVEAESGDELERIMKLVLVDHPEYFWLDGTSSYSFQELPGGQVRDMKVRPEYQTTQEEAQSLKREIEEKAQEWLAGAPQGEDTYEKIKYIYETLISQVDYDPQSPQNQNIRSVFLEGSTVCMGYAKAAQYLLNKLGIFCTLVTGTASDSRDSSHAWNLVKIGENYYYLDVTWGNPGYQNPEAQDDYISYTYLCCDWETLKRTHTPDGTIELPECTDDRYNYYKNKGCWYDSFDEEQIRQRLLEDLENRVKSTELKFGAQEAYEQAEQELVRGSLIKEAVQSSGVLPPGGSYSWQTYYGGSDWLIVISWEAS